MRLLSKHGGVMPHCLDDISLPSRDNSDLLLL